MRYGNMTPHQYSSMQPHIDTLLTTCWTGRPLDIASPHETDKWVGEFLLEQLYGRFHGRMAVITAGLAPTDDDGYKRLANQLNAAYGHPAHYGFILTAGVGAEDEVTFLQDTEAETSWYCVDWKCWFEQRVQPQRLPDLWAYLSYATGGYLRSAERKMYGAEQELAEEMARQGYRLLKQCTDWLVTVVQSTWLPTPQQLDT